ncbi:MAG: hypothetical protein QOE22_45 [Candidatus Parcubacteria bacterium]|jgi:uncharacterized protein YbaA (DUF1428 family)|nr:hypothetical protein [Candidatus Parcubacteria bacterium]
MAKYVDGYVVAIPKKNLAAYRKMAQMGAKLWRKHGALDYKECVGQDLNPKMGGMQYLPFPKLAKVKPGETVIFAYILYKSRAHRDAVNKKVMNDPVMNKPEWKDMPMPFEMKRMAWGGFEVIAGA